MKASATVEGLIYGYVGTFVTPSVENNFYHPNNQLVLRVRTTDTSLFMKLATINCTVLCIY